jgi:lactate permease
VDVTGTDPVQLFPTTALLLGFAVLLTGLSSAWVLGQLRHWRKILLLSLIVAATQYLVGILGLIPIGSFSAAVVGIVGGTLLSQKPKGWRFQMVRDSRFYSGILTYGTLIFGLMVIMLAKPVNTFLGRFTWTMAFPEVASALGHSTPAGNGYLFRPLIHPGTLLLLTILVSLTLFPRIKGYSIGKFRPALISSTKAALPACLGILFMIGLASLMEHTGMTLTLAKGISQIFGLAYPIFAPLVGMLGTFVTGANTYSNILFGNLQKSVAELLTISPILLLASQTVGGALGSMIAPAKLAVGGSTSNLKGREGEVLRLTLPIGLASALLIGLAAWLLSVL